MSDLQMVKSDESSDATTAKKLVRRRNLDSSAKNAKELQRRRSGTIAMSIVAILLLMYRRISYDSSVILAIETVAGLLLLMLACLAARNADSAGKSGSNFWSVLCVIAALAVPWIVNPIAKLVGNGNGQEIVMLTSLAWGGLAIALLSRQLKTLGLSVVCSGFLTLFATFISDSPLALWFSLAWGILCLWWLVNNYWSQIETAAAVGIQPARAQRIGFTLFGCSIFLVGAMIVSDRIPVVRKLQTELMPTSGGTSGKDSAARRGVGNGDALVAAKKHATSFGAVDTDVFLDSDKPSLFDVFSEEFGVPKKKLQRVERAQALSPQSVKNDDGKFTEANRAAGSSEFSIQRELPEERKPVNDLVSESLMFWQGESCAHLAAQRFEHFDGSVWSNVDLPSDSIGLADSTGLADTNGHSDTTGSSMIQSTKIGEQVWFSPSGSAIQNSISPFIDSLPEALKFTRYRSPIIPTRQGMQLWCIDQIDRQDFFATTPDGCLQMQDREHIPDYTVVRMVNSRIDLERLEKLVRNCSPGKSHQAMADDCFLELNRLSHEYSGKFPRGWQQVQSVISGLRKDFKLEHARPLTPSSSQSSPSQSRSEAFTLSQFLRDHRGPDYLFATAAAMMLDHLGYRTRFVAGFYANPKHYLAREGEISILPSDAHAWLEIDVGHGYWIPLEPSPGYRQPEYAANLWYQIKQHRWAIAMWTLTVGAIALCIYLLRRLLVEALSWVALPALFLSTDRRRIAWLTRLLDIRCQLAGFPRTKGTVLRKHLNRFQISLPVELVQQVGIFLESADRLWFGENNSLSKEDLAAISRVWRGLTIKALRRGIRRASEGQLA